MDAKKVLHFTFSFFLLLFIGIILSCSKKEKVIQNPSATPKLHVIYIHGWAPEENCSYEDERRLLEQTFPQSIVEIYEWNSNLPFNECLEVSGGIAEELATRIAGFSEEERSNTVLIGHSLGGRVVIKVMSSPQLDKLPIGYGVFLAAAISHDASEIDKAIKNSMMPNINIFNRQDYVLRHLYLVGDHQKSALGAFGYAFPSKSKEMHQYEIAMETPQIKTLAEYRAQMDNHFAVSYLNELKKILDGKMAIQSDQAEVMDDSTSIEAIERISVPQDRPNLPSKIIPELLSETLDSFDGWRLQRMKARNLYRIVDPHDYQRALGSEEKMREAFQSVKEQVSNMKSIAIPDSSL